MPSAIVNPSRSLDDASAIGDPRQWPIGDLGVVAAVAAMTHQATGRVMWTPITVSSAMAMPAGTVSVATP
jgi:hypothetical protein